VTSKLFSTLSCFKPYKPYTFWKLMTCTIHWRNRDDNDKDTRKYKDKDDDKDEMTKRPNMCHIFENDMNHGYQIQWWISDASLKVMHRRWWSILLIRRSCWCADPADAPILLMFWFWPFNSDLLQFLNFLSLTQLLMQNSLSLLRSSFCCFIDFVQFRRHGSNFGKLHI